MFVVVLVGLVIVGVVISLHLFVGVEGWKICGGWFFSDLFNIVCELRVRSIAVDCIDVMDVWMFLD